MKVIATMALSFMFAITAGAESAESKSGAKKGTEKGSAAAELPKTPLTKVETLIPIVISTSKGDIEVELNKTKAPKTVENFLRYVDRKFYDGLIFHRVIKDFMIQGGGMDPQMNEKATTEKPVQNEADNGLTNLRGTIAMARTSDPHSASAQFFINTVDNAFLNYRDKSVSGWGYAVFGKVTKGMEIVDKIREVATTTKGPHENVPEEPVTIKSIHRKTKS